MRRSRAATAEVALERFLCETGGNEDWERALRALTLWMVRGHAPTFFAAHALDRRLKAAVRALAEVPRRLPLELSALDGMSRIDAAWVEQATGSKPALPPAHEARAYVQAAALRDGALWAFVMSELLVQTGLGTCRLGIQKPIASTEEERLYWSTHELLLATAYLSRPASVGAFLEQAGEWEKAVGPLVVVKDADLLAEVAFCLQSVGAPSEPAVAGLERLVDERGQVGKETGYSHAHAVAAVLIALAGALDRAA